MAKHSRKTLLIDFDGVIHRYRKGWADGKAYDEPMEGAKDTLRILVDRGYHIVVFSTRPAEQIESWLEKWGFPAYQVTDRKIVAHAIIDDRAIRFTNWKDIGNYF